MHRLVAALWLLGLFVFLIWKMVEVSGPVAVINGLATIAVAFSIVLAITVLLQPE